MGVSLRGITLVLLILSHAALASEPVDLEIVIAADVSSSIDESEAALQRQGFANALRSPEVVSAIQSGAEGKIDIAYVDWSSEPWNRIIVDWRVIDGPASAEASPPPCSQRPAPMARARRSAAPCAWPPP